MAQRIGKCTNYSGCKLAYRNEKITVVTKEFRCPECGSPLESLGPKRGLSPTPSSFQSVNRDRSSTGHQAPSSGPWAVHPKRQTEVVELSPTPSPTPDSDPDRQLQHRRPRRPPQPLPRLQRPLQPNPIPRRLRSRTLQGHRSISILLCRRSQR